MKYESPYLTVVTTSRNDDHGGDPLIRTQISITTLARQCEKYKLPAEMLIVDWNPVPDRPGLAAVLEVPDINTYLKVRIITVPTTLHRRIKYAEKLPLFQMIAKNVGIRRAMGDFILATNIDIIFSDELMQFIAHQKLDPLKQYRVDRYDIQSGLSKDLSLDETLEYAWAHPIRTNRRYQPGKLIKHLYGDELFKRKCEPDPIYCHPDEGVKLVQDLGTWQIHPDRSVDMGFLHTNACGDFTLLSRQGWDTIGGYPEFAAYSFNIDSIGMIAAHYAGFTEVALLPPCVCFHIEHSVGSGWTPEGESKLFNRLRQAEILNPEWPVLRPLVNEMREKSKSLEFNHSGWGMAEFELPEQVMGDQRQISQEILASLTQQAEMRNIIAIQPEYDLDRLTLFHERRVLVKLGLNIGARLEKVQIFIPDESGRYREDNSISYETLFLKTSKIVFRLDKFPHNYPLRFDPCESRGTIDIISITAFDLATDRIIWAVNNNNQKGLLVTGTATMSVAAQGQVTVMPAIVQKPQVNVPGLYKVLSFGKQALLSPIHFIKKQIPLDIKIWLERVLVAPEQTSQPAQTNQNINAIHIINNGSDPQIYLPPMLGNIGFPVSITVEMKFTPVNQ